MTLSKFISLLSKFYDTVWNWPPKVRNTIESWGDRLQVILPVSFLAYAMAIDSHLAFVFACSFGVAMLICELVKAIFNNPRPNDVEGSVNPELEVGWSPSDNNSFLSGHTTAAMIGALFWFIPDPCFGLIATFLGLFTGFSRMVAKAHWLRDVLAAIALCLVVFSIALVWFV